MEGQSLSHFQFLNDKNLLWRGRRLIKNVGLSFGNNDRKISKYKNRFQGKKVFILGNGPSLDLHDLTSLKGEIVFCANWFPKSPVYPDFKYPFFLLATLNFGIIPMNLQKGLLSRFALINQWNVFSIFLEKKLFGKLEIGKCEAL